ncbi:MAG TPA: hypothetical protein VH878_06970 [Thermodesulfobacteriota bacterium]
MVEEVYLNAQLLFLSMDLNFTEKVEVKFKIIKVVKSCKIELEELGII